MAKTDGARPDGHDRRLTADDLMNVISGGDEGERTRAGMQESGQFERGKPSHDKEAPELHVCMGLNSCAGHGRGGSGLMAGMGECATVSHECHGANECRGQGGCGYSGFDGEQSMPGAQECRYSGSCASPVNVSRIHAAGPFRGTSVWKRARKVFEQRMYEAGVPFGPSPGEGFPDAEVPLYEKSRTGGRAAT